MRSFAKVIVLAGLSVSGLLADLPVGGKVAEIKVTLSGAAVSITPSKAEATVVVFMSTTCPISNAYNERMSALYRDYQGKNVQFVFVNANRNESPAAIEDHAHL